MRSKSKKVSLLLFILVTFIFYPENNKKIIQKKSVNIVYLKKENRATKQKIREPESRPRLKKIIKEKVEKTICESGDYATNCSKKMKNFTITYKNFEEAKFYDYLTEEFNNTKFNQLAGNICTYTISYPKAYIEIEDVHCDYKAEKYYYQIRVNNTTIQETLFSRYRDDFFEEAINPLLAQLKIILFKDYVTK